jgi:hypothetical protein
VLLLVTLFLVVASAILLVLGFVQSTLGYIYLSMVCAGVAALALIVFARLARRRAVALAGAGALSARTRTTSGDSPWGSTEATFDRPPLAMESDDDGEPGAVPLVDGNTEVGLAAAEPEVGAAQVAVVPEAESAASPEAEDEGDWDWGDEVVFPIEDYDELRVAEIVPLLSQLEPDELQDVRDREVAGKARSTILDRIDELTGAKPKTGRRRAPPRSQPESETTASPSKAAPPRRQPAPVSTRAVPAAKRATTKSTPGAAPAKRTTTKKAGAASETPSAPAAKKAPARRADASQASAPPDAAAEAVKQAPAKRTSAAKKAR